MEALPQPDAFQVQAAEGWMMLGNPLEANEELEKISPAYRTHPSVLALRWQIYSQVELWEAAWVVARALCMMLPDHAEVWACQAHSLRNYKGNQEAYDLLLSVIHRFPNNAVLHYNLACYACQIGKLDEAWKWLMEAFQKEKEIQLRLLAWFDTDLKPLWEHIQKSASLS